MIDLSEISTEKQNEQTTHIDTLSTLDMVRLINSEDKKVAIAVESELENVAKAVDVIYKVLHGGGRLIYCGCGTSGRIGVLDSVECPPTFGTDYEMVQALIAGGDNAFIKAVEGAEDNKEMGVEDLKRINFNNSDVLVGIAASGRTPYVIGAMEYAKSLSAPVIAVACSSPSQMEQLADISIVPKVGPEVITGSTRLKSGTAQKMVLNMLSTGSMIKLGKVYGNLMVDVKASNEKLIERCSRIVCLATGKTNHEAKEALAQCNYSAKVAIVMLLANTSAKDAAETLENVDGRIHLALKALH